MRKSILKFYLLALILQFLFPSFHLESQPKQQRVGPPPWTQANSPEFHPDSTVSFRIWAPRAVSVSLECHGILGDRPGAMQKNGDDIWSIRVKPLKPGLHDYRFIVDGVRTADPTNAIGHGSTSQIFVRGQEVDYYTEKHVPHGAIHRHFYHSDLLDAERPVQVYTPPGYEDHPDKIYPALYLLHGSGGTDKSWIEKGRAHIIIDNLLAQDRTRSMIIIMPYGHTVEPGTSGWPFVQEKGDFTRDLVEELMPFAHNHYRTSNNPAEVAIAGFSMGGFHSLKIGLNHPDLFGSIGVMSWGRGQEFFKDETPDFYHDPTKYDGVTTLWIACGKDDFLFSAVEQMHSYLQEIGLMHSLNISEGGHEWENWRNYLYQYAQLLFR